MLDTRLTLRYRVDKTWRSEEMVTDGAGEASIQVQLEAKPSISTVRYNVSYAGDRLHLSAAEVGSINVLTPVAGFPYVPLLIALVVASGAVALVYTKMKAKRAEEPGEDESAQPPMISLSSGLRLTLRLPQIREPLPYVWGVGEELGVETHAQKLEASFSGVRVHLTVDGVEHSVPVTGDGGAAVESLVFDEKGVVELGASCLVDGERAEVGLRLRVVDYREEVIRLFNEEFEGTRARMGLIEDHFTAREFSHRLREATPEEAWGPLDEMVFIFEEADYSTHEIVRAQYEQFYRAKIGYKGVLDG
jgi:hypothetical protein